jgi:hypothetical protein
VILAQKRGFSYLLMAFLYFISDVVLAFVFEPLMLLAIHGGKKSPRISRINATLKKANERMLTKSGIKPGPFFLVMFAFGADPMSGRAATKAAGHGVVSGWTIAILGDMLSFLVVMASTLWLNHLLGDGTLATVIIMVAMIVIPSIVRRVREKLKKSPSKF